MTQIYLLIILNITVVFLAYIFFKKNLIKINELKSEITNKTKIIEAQNLVLDEFHQMDLSKESELNDAHKLYFQLESRLEKTKSDLIIANKAIKTLEVDHKLQIKQIIETTRKETLKKSRAVLRGQASEHLAPYVLKDTNPKDYRFMGNPVDYICFNGLSDVLDGKSDSIQSVDFIDIKTGKSSLNKSQRRIRDAITNNKVTFKVINLDEVLNNNKVKDSTQVESFEEN